MRILITNNTLDVRGGSELYVRDLAIGLLKRGHSPIAYSTQLGDVARDLRAATIPVIDDLDALALPPDVIHGQHHLETMTALLRFTGVPAVSFCHGWLPWEESPPRFPRILQYVAVDHTCRDRLILEGGISPERVRVLLNFVDLERFKHRPRLPVRPQRALVFSNYANESTHAPAVREACARVGIPVDVIGAAAGTMCARPEEILGRYDIIFAKGRSALEALAVGAAVVLCDANGVGPLVTSSQFDHLRLLNFGLRALRDPVNADVLERQISRYDAEDASRVSGLVRAGAGRDATVDQIISLYGEVIAQNERLTIEPGEEARAAAAYLRWLKINLKSIYANEDRAGSTQIALGHVNAECDRLRGVLVQRDQTLQTVAMQAKEAEEQLGRITGSLGWRLLSLYGPLKYKVLLPAYRRLAGIIKSGNDSKVATGIDQFEGSAATDEQQNHCVPEVNSTPQINSPEMKKVFSDIYRRRAWGEAEESVSGPGSSVARTAAFRDAIPVLLKETKVRTVLDAGCGDFNWLRLVKLDLERYIGVDVVPQLISKNQREYGNATRTFLNVDISRERLPKVDLIFSRDCLVHFSNKDVFIAIKNFKQSGSTYLLTTTHALFDGNPVDGNVVDVNPEIDTGAWRPLNLQKSPFNFPAPLELIEEHRRYCGEVGLVKYLALWALDDLHLP